MAYGRDTDFLETVKRLVAARDKSYIRSLARRVIELNPCFSVPREEKGRNYREFKIFGSAVGIRLAWIVRDADPSVTGDIELIMAAVGLRTDDDSVGYFLRHCWHATQNRDLERKDLPDRYLSGAQLKGESATAFRKAVRERGGELLGAHGQYPRRGLELAP